MNEEDRTGAAKTQAAYRQRKKQAQEKRACEHAEISDAVDALIHKAHMEEFCSKGRDFHQDRLERLKEITQNLERAGRAVRAVGVLRDVLAD